MRIVNQFRPQIIQTNSEMAMSYAWPLARMKGIKLINATIRNAFSGRGLRWRWHQAMLQLADARVGNSRAGFHSRGLSPARDGNFVIYNGIDMDRFQTGVDRSPSFGLRDARQKIVGMVAEFSDYKDFPTFIRAAQLILEHRDDVLFLAVGGGKNLQACQQLVSRDESRIVFLGQRDDVDLLVQQIDIGVLCTFSEGISNSLMELMAAGKPVIATKAGGSSELIVDGQSGFLVSAANPYLVAEKIEMLLTDFEKARLMGNEGHRRLKECFSLEALVENHIRMYQAVLAV
jgi:glycosyltransferase involved in cell wall biosynthesis